MRIIGYHIWNGIIANSNGEYTTEAPFIDWLLKEQGNDVIRIFYYLAQDMSAFCKMCNFNEEQLVDLHKSSQKKIDIPPYKIRYVKDRFLNLQKGFYRTAPYAYFYDAHQYKNVEAEDDNTIEKIIEKAKIAKQIGQDVYDTFNKLGIHTSRLISPIRAYEDATLSKLNLPTIDDIPEMIGYYAYQGCVGNWLEAYQVGHWEKVWDYDINSAYPSIIAQQMDLRLGHWVKSNKIVPEARYAECLCNVNINSWLSPIIYRAGERNNLPLNFTPTGKRETILNKRLIDLIEMYDEDSYEIKEGNWWIPDKEVKPLEMIIRGLFLSKETEIGTSKEVIKRIMNGIYGKLLQTTGEVENSEFGKLFNPVWAEDVETAIRVENTNFIIRNKLIPIHIAVDGVVSANPAILGEEGMGKWKLTNISPCICCGTGNVAMRNNNGNGDFSLTYDKIKRIIEENPENSEYKLSKKSPVTLAEAVNDKKKIDKLGTLQEIYKYIGIGQDEKRCYKKKPNNGKELLEGKYISEPWDISTVKNLEI